jgi:hypothetical protein
MFRPYQSHVDVTPKKSLSLASSKGVVAYGELGALSTQTRFLLQW